VPKPLTERELIELQIKTYDFYARLIDRAIGGAAAAKLPKWDVERAREYEQLANDLRARLAEMDEQALNAPATDPVAVDVTAGPESSTSSTEGPSPE
jgi:hypothetical protein